MLAKRHDSEVEMIREVPPTVKIERHNGVEALLILAVAICLFEGIGSLVSALPALNGAWTINTALMLTKSVVYVVVAVAAMRDRRFLWSAYIAIFALRTTLFGVSCGLLAHRLLEMQHPLLAIGAIALLIGGVASLVGAFAVPCAVWIRHTAFGIPTHHRWRYLVKHGVTPAVLIVIIDAYSIYDRFWVHYPSN